MRKVFRTADSAAAVKNYVAEHIGQRIEVGEIAQKLKRNASYLNTSFKAQTGECITVYIHKAKIERAMKLLEEDRRRSIADICTALSYYDQSHFTRMFKRFTGKTPKEFRALKGK
jgi:AraC-like DNA-binding protein